MATLFKADSIPMVKNDRHTLGWLSYGELDDRVSTELYQRLHEGADQEDNWASYDCYDDYDIFYFAIPEELRDSNSLPQVGAVISKSEVLIVYKHWETNTRDYIPGLLKNAMAKRGSAHRAVLSIIDFVTKNDGVYLAKIEDSVTTLEEKIMKLPDSELRNMHDEITKFRRRIQPMQQMYEQLMDALEDLMEDENELYGETDTKYATRLHNRVERLYKTVINLRDYISQVREAYQTQLDIGLNNVMKVFTVLTAVFLPLTLLTSWYGMNFESMIELKWEYSYPVFIGVAVFVALGCLLFFKKKRWF